MQLKVKIFTLAVCVFGCAFSEAIAQEKFMEDDKAIISMVLENDIAGGTDQNYTNGVRLSWLSSEGKTPQWAQWAARNLLPLDDAGSKRIGLSLGQNMYTLSYRF